MGTYTILAVADEATLAALEPALRAARYRVIAAVDPDSARDMLDRHPIDAVLCDVDLPLRSGRRFVSDASSHPRRVQVIAIHADADDAWQAKLDGVRATAVFRRPVRTDEVLRALDDALGSRPRARDDEPTDRIRYGAAVARMGLRKSWRARGRG